MRHQIDFETLLGGTFTTTGCEHAACGVSTDRATPHTSQMAFNWLNDHFGTRVISVNTSHVWAPKSPDLNPLDRAALTVAHTKTHHGR